MNTNEFNSILLFPYDICAESLREKCPNSELNLVRIFLYSDWIQENIEQE